jgi:lipoic acid synthetase
MQTIERKPIWLKARAPLGETYAEVKKVVTENALHTVCQEANCPNRLECWSQRTATFLILGSLCTRGCTFCNIARGKPGKLVDDAEPERVADAVMKMNLRYAVVTSVTRDDLADGGARIFAETVRAIRRKDPSIGIEVLIPDFRGNEQSLDAVIESGPDVINHNIETVRRLSPIVRKGANYDRTLELLRRVAERAGCIATKSGIIVGLGETVEELRQTFGDLAASSCQLLTIGQYLSPSGRHQKVEKYYTPDEFKMLRDFAMSCGFKSVLAGPLVRSSYHARAQADSAHL